MRVWDLPPQKLCREHLLGQHFEIHVMWSALVGGKKGWRNHPETRRWESHLGALRRKHDETVEEMLKRGYNHESPLDNSTERMDREYPDPITPVEEQERILNELNCDCHFNVD